MTELGSREIVASFVDGKSCPCSGSETGKKEVIVLYRITCAQAL